MRILLALLLAVCCTGPALAQGWGKKYEGRGGGQQQMREEDRQRMREDMRDVNRDRRDERFSRDRPRQMSTEERDKLRRDVEDANRGFRK
jgi:hypothetical protein